MAHKPKITKHDNTILPEKVSGKFELNPAISRIPKVFTHFRLGSVNLKTLTIEKAKILSNDKDPYLVEIKKP